MDGRWEWERWNGEEKRKKNETDGAKWRKKERGRDGPPTLEHRERGVCFARCFYSGEARCRRTVCLEVGQVSMTVPQSLYGLCLRACAYQANQCTCIAATRRCNVLLRSTIFQLCAPNPFFPLLPSTSSPTLPRILSSVLPSLLRINPPLSLSLPPPTLRDFARIQRKERERASLRENRSLGIACSSFSFFLHFDQVTRELIRTSPPVRKSGEGVGHDNEQSSGWSG